MSRRRDLLLLTFALPPEVADVCAFLASEESRYITGASVEVTGKAGGWADAGSPRGGSKEVKGFLSSSSSSSC